MGQESPMDNDTWESPKKKPPCYLLLIESDKSGLCTELPVIKQEQSRSEERRVGKECTVMWWWGWGGAGG